MKEYILKEYAMEEKNNKLNIGERIIEHFSNNWMVYVFVVLFGIVVYAPAIIDELPNPDALWTGTLYKSGYGWEMSLGRYMIAFWQLLFAYNISTSFNTILAIIIWVITSQILLDVIGIKGNTYRIIGGCLMLLTPFVQGGITYYYCFVYYSFAGLFASLAIVAANYSETELKKKGMQYVIGIILWCLSLATYQAFLSMFISIGMLVVICDVLNEEKKVIDILKRIIGNFCVFAGGIVAYIVSNKIVLSLFGIETNDGRGFSSMGVLRINQLLVSIFDSYKSFYEYYFGNTLLNNGYGVMISRRSINVLFFLFLVFVVFMYVVLNKSDIIRKLISLILICLIPACVFSIVILAPEASIHNATGPLMLPATNIVYIMPYMLISRMDKKYLLNYLEIFASVLVIAMLTQLNADCLNYLKYKMNKMEYLAYDISSQIEKNMNFKVAHKICIIGNETKGNYPDYNTDMKAGIRWTTASYGTIWDDFYGTQGCWRSFMNNYLGTNYEECSWDEYKKLSTDNDLSSMPVFPESGSIENIDGIVVVKLSNDLWN